MTGTSAGCITGAGKTWHGAADYDATTRSFSGFVLLEDRGDCFHVVRLRN